MIRNLPRSMCTLLLAFASLLPGPAFAAAVQPAAVAPDPVVFVHGWNSDGSVWQTMAGRFRTDGWPSDRLDQWTYDTAQSNTTTAAQLAEEIQRVLDRTGATKVDVVAHSMGSLSSRYYLKNLNGAAKVDAWVSLAGPNHGTTLAQWCGGASCVEMRPGSDFLGALNSGDETPGAPRYATWASPCDSVINPRDSVALAGAVNTTTGCLDHSGLRTDQKVYEEVKTHLR
ncbi:esterase/lipase family protein [Streptomyces sp. NPDC051561]|uniref:esterase/lipase family protein n=1 Tax=Streptomyces sp. NPDC051561 TaxID=3365658 RepID=UPI003789E499